MGPAAQVNVVIGKSPVPAVQGSAYSACPEAGQIPIGRNISGANGITFSLDGQTGVNPDRRRGWFLTASGNGNLGTSDVESVCLDLDG